MNNATTASLPSDASRAMPGAALRQGLHALPPELYRSEAFAEDLDLPPAPQPLQHAAPAATRRVAAWLLAVPHAVAWIASAMVVGGLPP